MTVKDEKSYCIECGTVASHEDIEVTETFQLRDEQIIVPGILARKCTNCGALTFTAEATDVIRQHLHGSGAIDRLAAFWDTHDVTDFEDELEEVTESVFVRAAGTT